MERFLPHEMPTVLEFYNTNTPRKDEEPLPLPVSQNEEHAHLKIKEYFEIIWISMEGKCATLPFLHVLYRGGVTLTLRVI
jgi:hypothetical protein